MSADIRELAERMKRKTGQQKEDATALDISLDPADTGSDSNDWVNA